MSKIDRDPLATYLEHHGAAAGAETHARMRERLEAALARRAAARRRWIHWAQAAVVTAAAAVLLVLLWPAAQTDAERTEVTTRDHAHDIALPHDGLLRVRAHTRIRLDVGNGATVQLLDGAVELDVESAPGAVWRVIAGDYAVTAVGTRFEVRKTEAEPDVRVFEGTVRITGPGLPDDGVEATAPELARADAKEVSASAPPVEPAHPVVPEPEAEPEPDPEPEPDVGSRGPPRSRSDPAAPPWIDAFRSAVREGAYERAVEQLPPDFPRGVHGLRATDLVDAGDALRSTGDIARAEAAYEAACSRKNHPACGTATFRRALVRAKLGDRDAAIDLMGDYLARHPTGSLARDAVGRRMQWYREAGRDADARREAKTYLERWPTGSRADLAREITGD